MPLTIGQRPDHGFDEPLGLLSDCHRRIEFFLEVLGRITDHAKGGPLPASQRAQLEGALAYFAAAAPRHTADEEESLFPRLRASPDPAARETLDALDHLARDHALADERHRAVDRLGRLWLSAGRLTASEVHALREHLAALQTIYRPHIELEDRELFPAATRLLSTEQLAAIGREMAARRSSSASASRHDRQSD
jgi:hemerythrin-like domain-containing protein